MDQQDFFEGKDLDEALGSASARLGIPEDDLHYEIVDTGRRGVFGLGAKSVRIRVKPPLAELPQDEEPQADKPQVDKPQVEKPRRPNKPRQESQEAPREKPRQPKGRERGGRPPRKRSPRGQGARQAEANRNGGDPAERDVRPVPEEVAAEVERTVKQITELMGLELEIRCASLEGGVTLELAGDDSKLLKEKNAELLLAIQFVLNRMARRAWPDAGRIHLSCDGRARRRDDELVELAREVAEQVSHTGQTKKLQPMNAYERRLVHLTVREYSGLTSSSDGNGAMKRVRISKVQNQL